MGAMTRHRTLISRIWRRGVRQASLKGTTPLTGRGDLPFGHWQPLEVPSFMVWGANTDVGKTLVSAGLIRAARQQGLHSLFVKPVATGFPKDADGHLVGTAAAIPHQLGWHAAQLAATPAAAPQQQSEDPPSQHQTASHWPSSPSLSTTLFAWQEPVSPHVAAAKEGRGVSDGELQHAVLQQLQEFAGTRSQRPLLAADDVRSRGSAAAALALVETAGGPASPGPSGSLQCDAWRPLRMPAILVGDSRLGGISATITALETLNARGYTVAAILFVGDETNWQAVSQHLASRPSFEGAQTSGMQIVRHIGDAPPPPPSERSPGAELDPALQQWLAETQGAFGTVLQQLQAWHQVRVDWLQSAAGRAQQALWWPFTQHKTLNSKDVTLIDARCGESFAVVRTAPDAQQAGPDGSAALGLETQYDACASWWTQDCTPGPLQLTLQGPVLLGMSAELQPWAAQAMSHAAGRYGHVMFPENVYEPALECAEKLLRLVGGNWASKVFFSDDGSTANEVALKMAFRKFRHDRAEELSVAATSGQDMELHVVGITNGYHGDTLGVMDAVAPSPYVGPEQMPWNHARGLFLDPPTVGTKAGAEVIFAPDGLWPKGQAPPATQEEREQLYSAHIRTRLQQHEASARCRVGACIIEPVLQGAGGMLMIDLPFQRALVGVCQEQGIPVIFDEVFTGLWRLGSPSGAMLLGLEPDIACFAKLLTGGMVPLAATLARKNIFAAFQGDSKLQALLHGHSYTGHAVGCAAANAALSAYTDPRANRNLCSPAGGSAGTCPRQPQCEGSCGMLVPLWDEAVVRRISQQPGITHVTALGTVLAVGLQPAEGQGGYSATDALKVVKQLRKLGVYARPLGNVVYLMVGPTTARETCSALLSTLCQALAAKDQT